VTLHSFQKALPSPGVVVAGGAAAGVAEEAGIVVAVLTAMVMAGATELASAA